ncbi:SAM-dependent methyltransferase [Methanoregula sp.]|uniref:class I SAM-dependent methyltransferase n=1 Tax=Methanoregula sp. TaxID=2052170 RepID=UPI002B649B5C|nr:SAM-dependent methyltransferase [Methanoregula sp.]HVP97383.1 SAM-dependent methyltransferase [Methanoregula sp.]
MRVREVRTDQLGSVRGEAWVDEARHPYVEGETAWVPVRDGFSFDRELPERHVYTGRGYFMLGDVAVVHGDRPSAEGVEEIVRFRQPRGVLWIASLAGVTRTPQSEVLWGNVDEVCHREEGYTYYLDPRRVMFAQGNREEKMRMAGIIREGPAGARVADMFAGIGYFTIPMAGSGANVHAMEINPVACEYLECNIRANGLAKQVQVSCGDCRAHLAGIYDRIVMGHFDAVTMLSMVYSHVRAGSVIHVHSIGDVSETIRKSARGAGFSPSIHVHKVKKYRPHTWHIVQDVTLS